MIAEPGAELLRVRRKTLQQLTPSRVTKIAPRTAVPADPPIRRNSVAPDVATTEIAIVDGILHGDDEHRTRADDNSSIGTKNCGVSACSFRASCETGETSLTSSPPFQ